MRDFDDWIGLLLDSALVVLMFVFSAFIVLLIVFLALRIGGGN